MNASVRVEGAHPGDLSAIRWLLGLEELPSEDVTELVLGDFLVARDDLGVVAVVGLERYDQVGLLRSLVVSGERRGCGVGGLLVAAIEERARALGIRDLYLLTQTAAGFFAQRGFRHIDRSEAPPEIRATREYSHLCPQSAALMVKS